MNAATPLGAWGCSVIALGRNRQTCEQWLQGVRVSMMQASLGAGCYTSTIWHGTKRLQVLLHSLAGSNLAPKGSAKTKQVLTMEMWKKVGQTEAIMAQIVAALLQRRQPLAIKGLATIVRQKTPKELVQTLAGQRWMTWLGAAVSAARGNLERAATEYTQAMVDYTVPSLCPPIFPIPCHISVYMR